MSWATVLAIALILVCPISMLWMMLYDRRRRENQGHPEDS